MKWRDLYASYHESLHLRVRESTRDRYAQSAKSLLVHFGPMELSEINERSIAEYVEKRARKVSIPTINTDLKVLKATLTKAKKWKLASEVPEVEKFPEGAPRIRTIRIEELNRLLRRVPQYMSQLIVMLICTGMRRNELVYLTWDRVDLDRKTVVLTETKTGQIRMAYLSATALAILRAQPRCSHIPYVFYNPHTGKPYTKLSACFHRQCVKAGIRGLRLHDLRKTAGTWLRQGGVPIETIADILGHSDSRITKKYYAHLSVGHMVEAVTVLDNRLKKILDSSTTMSYFIREMENESKRTFRNSKTVRDASMGICVGAWDQSSNATELGAGDPASAEV